MGRRLVNTETRFQDRPPSVVRAISPRQERQPWSPFASPPTITPCCAFQNATPVGQKPVSPSLAGTVAAGPGVDGGMAGPESCAGAAEPPPSPRSSPSAIPTGRESARTTTSAVSARLLLLRRSVSMARLADTRQEARLSQVRVRLGAVGGIGRPSASTPSGRLLMVSSGRRSATPCPSNQSLNRGGSRTRQSPPSACPSARTASSAPWSTCTCAAASRSGARPSRRSCTLASRRPPSATSCRHSRRWAT